MNLRDLDLKDSYINQGSENIVDCLINPAIKLSKTYRRSVGFFSSSVFGLLQNSLSTLIKNAGKIQLIVSPNISSDDADAIKQGYEKKELIRRRFVEDFDGEIRKFDDFKLNYLSELIAHDILDIRVAAVKNEIGMYHDKLGIFEDNSGNKIVFYGSANSSINGYQNNYEKIRLVKSWNLGDYSKVENEINEFDTLWNNKNNYVDVYQFKESIQNCIIKITDERKQAKKNKTPIKLYDYQEEAIKAWVANGYRGFYVMATGTGKTWTAIYSAKTLMKNQNCLLVIAAPYKHLLKQWEQDIIKVFDDAEIVLISSENQEWVNIAKQKMLALKYNPNKKIIFITTIKSFYSEKFNSVMKINDIEKLLIVDEAHRFTKRSESLKNQFKYLLGLSATPINGKNIHSGEDLVNFFGGVVFNLPIEVALEKGFLVPYYYHPIFVNATEEEENRFDQISKKIPSCFRNNILIDKDALVRYSRARLRIISMAQEKIDNIRDLLNHIENKSNFIVYCGDGRLFDDKYDEEIKHIQYVKKQIDMMGLKTSQFTASEDMKRRMEVIEMFNNNHIDSLVAIKCLDEGVNIPSIKSALILASNDDYREFVQRRGRILRKYEGKNYATIYDVIVLPSIESIAWAKIEFRRYFEYAKLSINYKEILDQFNILLKDYTIDLEDIQFYLENEIEGDIDD